MIWLISDARLLNSPTYTAKGTRISQSSSDRSSGRDPRRLAFGVEEDGAGGVGGRAGMKNDGYRVHCFEEDDDDDPCRKVEKRMLGCCLPRPRRTNVSRNAMGSLLASRIRYAFCKGAVVGSLRPTSYSTVNREDKKTKFTCGNTR